MDFLPFEKLSYQMIGAFRKKGKRWLVSQTLNASLPDPSTSMKTLLLMTHYSDKDTAFVHLTALQSDRFGSVIDLERDIHRRQLDNVLANDSKYIAFSSLIRDREKVEAQAHEKYREQYWRYLRLHSKSGISPTKTLRSSLQLVFGELFVVLKYGGETLRPRLTDIEKL